MVNGQTSGDLGVINTIEAMHGGKPHRGLGPRIFDFSNRGQPGVLDLDMAIGMIDGEKSGVALR